MMVYGEYCAIPLDVDIKSRMPTFWARLCSGDKHKFSNTIYSLLYTLDEKYIFKSEWVDNSEQLRIFWIIVESIIVLFYWSIQTFSKDKIKISVYLKIARNYITRRKVYSLLYF